MYYCIEQKLTVCNVPSVIGLHAMKIPILGSAGASTGASLLYPKLVHLTLTPTTSS
jgi:hypothetical protein